MELFEATHGVVEALVSVPVPLQAAQLEGVEGADRDDGEVSRQQRHLGGGGDGGPAQVERHLYSTVSTVQYSTVQYSTVQ